MLELATIVFDESSTSVDNLVSRILFNSIFLLECEKCQVILIDNSITAQRATNNSFSLSNIDRVYELNYDDLQSSDAFSFGIYVKPNTCVPNYNDDELDIIKHVYSSGQVGDRPSLN